MRAVSFTMMSTGKTVTRGPWNEGARISVNVRAWLYSAALLLLFSVGCTGSHQEQLVGPSPSPADLVSGNDLSVAALREDESSVWLASTDGQLLSSVDGLLWSPEAEFRRRWGPSDLAFAGGDLLLVGFRGAHVYSIEDRAWRRADVKDRLLRASSREGKSVVCGYSGCFAFHRSPPINATTLARGVVQGVIGMKGELIYLKDGRAFQLGGRPLPTMSGDIGDAYAEALGPLILVGPQTIGLWDGATLVTHRLPRALADGQSWVTLDTADATRVAAASLDGKVLYSQDAGASWSVVHSFGGQSAATQTVVRLAFVPREDRLLALVGARLEVLDLPTDL